MQLDVHHWIGQYGYLGIFIVLMLEMIGVPFPAETTLIAAGIEWTRGTFSLFPLILSVVFGNIAGSSVAYSLGRFLGTPIIVRFGKYVGITEERMGKAERKFNQYRGKVILSAKFIAGIRVLVPYLAGINRMPFALFSLYNSISAVVWAIVFVVLGKYLGLAWNRYHLVFHSYLLLALVGAVLLAGVVLVIRRKRRHRT